MVSGKNKGEGLNQHTLMIATPLSEHGASGWEKMCNSWLLSGEGRIVFRMERHEYITVGKEKGSAQKDSLGWKED